MKHLLIGLLVTALLLSIVPLCSAAATTVTVTYTFSGDNAAAAGFGEGTITVTPASGVATSGYYLLYFANDSGLLSGYDEFASIPITGGTVSYTVKEGTLLPPSATKIVVFESTAKFLVSQPSYSQRVATVTIPSYKQLTLGEPSFTFGAVSDVHIMYETLGYGAKQKWVNTLNFFAAQNMDKVIVTGDMTGDEHNAPMTEQYEEYLGLIAQSDYPLADIHECIGNHGNTTVGRAQFVQYTSGAGETRPYEDSPWFSVLIEGETSADRDNLFLFMAQEIEASGVSAQVDNFSAEQMDWLEEMLTTYGDTDTNIYLIEHSPFRNYGPGDRYNGDYTGMINFSTQFPQNMRLKGLLETYKNIIHLSGHTHLSLYDNYNYSTENGTSCRMVHVPSGCQPATYNNANDALGSGDGRQTVNASYGSEAYTVRVYDGYIVFTGHNLTTGKIIPSACYILPTVVQTETDTQLEGKGTLEEPYLIQDAADFKTFTNNVNRSTSSTQTEMYGYGQYFLQTADIDMTGVSGYLGTAATGGSKTYFAGIYNGAGHTLTVDIQASGMRSVFPYTYGTIANLHFKGRIHAEDGAQPIRSLYGNVVNCLVDMDLSADCANGLLYSNYSYTYNIYTHGTLGGAKPDAFTISDYSEDYHNLYHWYTLADGTAVTDAQGTRSNNAQAIAAVFNDRTSDAYKTALATLGGFEMEEVAASDGDVVFAWKRYAIGDVDLDGEPSTADARIVVKDLLYTPSRLTLTQKHLADIDENGQINSRDLRMMLGLLIK